MIVNHDLEIAENLAVSPVGLLASLCETAHALPVKDAMGLRVEDEWYGEQAFDPFCCPVSMQRPAVSTTP